MLRAYKQANKRYKRRQIMQTSARNAYQGTVANVIQGAVNAEVVLNLPGGAQLVAVITNDSAKKLGLAAGKPAAALVKASSVILAVDLQDAKISARNVFTGTVCKMVEGPVSTEVDIDANGTIVSAVVTSGSAKRLGLSVGAAASAIIKASSVLIAVD